MEEDFFGSSTNVTITLTKAEAICLAMSYVLFYKNTSAFSIAENLSKKVLNQISKQ